MTENTAKVFDQIKNSQNLPSLPQFLIKLIETCNNEDAPISELAEIICQDPSTCTRIIDLVNSSYCGLNHKITSIKHAVILLGGDAIKNIAISASVQQVFSNVKANNLFNLNHFWWHSFMCASLARRIAIKISYEFIEEAFLSGLLHDIGKLLLYTSFTNKYSSVLEHSDKERESIALEKKIIGVTHYEAGAWLIKQWKLKSFMADAVLYHHDHLERIQKAFPLVKIIFMANMLTNADDLYIQKNFTALNSLFGFDQPLIDEIILGAKEDVEEVSKSLNISLEQPKNKEEGTSEEKSNESTELLHEVKNISLLSGTMQNLLKADNIDSILMVVQQGLKILLNTENIFFFIYNSEKKYLTGYLPGNNQNNSLIHNLIIPFKEDSSLIARSLAKGLVLDSFNCLEGVTGTIADEQIIHQFGTEGMLCVPMIAQKKQIGVMVLGVSSFQNSSLSGQLKLLKMFADQAAICLHVYEIKQKQAEKIQIERMEASEMIARKVAHEVNNPLGIIKNYLKILESKIPEKNLIKSELKILGKEIERIAQIIKLLSNSASTKKTAPYDINALLDDFLGILKKAILTPSSIDLNFIPDTSLPEVMFDKSSIKQVLLNLIKNSKEAMPDGGKIYVETRLVSARRKFLFGDEQKITDNLEIIIKDNGPGIDDDISSRLFEPFQSSKGDENSGLGLFIVHGIIKELKGTIKFNSEKGKGVLFKIILPLVYNKKK